MRPGLGQLISTASLGTGNENNEYVNATTPPTRPSLAPMWDFDPTDPPTTPPIPPTLNLQGLPAFTKVTNFQEHDHGAASGRFSVTIRPDGTASISRYNNLGQFLLVTENAADALANWSQTGYLYDGSRLIKVAAWSGSQPSPAWRSGPRRPRCSRMAATATGRTQATPSSERTRRVTSRLAG